MKKFTFKGVLDGIRSKGERPEDGPAGGGGKAGPGAAGGPGRPGQEPGVATEIPENLRPEHFRVLKVQKSITTYCTHFYTIFHFTKNIHLIFHGQNVIMCVF